MGIICPFWLRSTKTVNWKKSTTIEVSLKNKTYIENIKFVRLGFLVWKKVNATPKGEKTH